MILEIISVQEVPKISFIDSGRWSHSKNSLIQISATDGNSAYFAYRSGHCQEIITWMDKIFLHLCERILIDINARQIGGAAVIRNIGNFYRFGIVITEILRFKSETRR